VIARLLAIAAILLSALTAPAAMAAAMPAGPAASAVHMDGMGDCHAPAGKSPAGKSQPCKVDCALCHAVAPAVAVLGSAAVTYAALAPAELSAWTDRPAEVEPPIPRSAS